MGKKERARVCNGNNAEKLVNTLTFILSIESSEFNLGGKKFIVVGHTK